jgi:hypothetical protein
MEELKKLLDQTIVERSTFHKIISTLKVLPEFFKWAKNNN